MKRLGRRFDPERLKTLIFTNSMNVSDFVRKIRAEVGAMTNRGVWAHLTGSNLPSADTLADYADFFNVPVDFFYTRQTIEYEPLKANYIPKKASRDE